VDLGWAWHCKLARAGFRAGDGVAAFVDLVRWGRGVMWTWCGRGILSWRGQAIKGRRRCSGVEGPGTVRLVVGWNGYVGQGRLQYELGWAGAQRWSSCGHGHHDVGGACQAMPPPGRARAGPSQGEGGICLLRVVTG
jgi:hypothetical protein